MWWLIIPVTIYSAVILALWSILRRIKIPGLPSGENKTRISVVVPCHNEEKNIERLISCLSKQNYPLENYEVIITDDNSSDNTVALIQEAISSLPPGSADIRLIHNQGSGKKSALRAGISESRGELILTTDADCRVGPRWISAFVSCFEKTGADMILGSVAMLSSGTPVSGFAVAEFSALQGITEATAFFGFPVMSNGANMGFRKSVYLSHSSSLHDEVPSGDDMFLLHSVRHAGGRIKFIGCGAAAAETAAAVSVAALLRQRARWASRTSLYRDTPTLTLAAATAACNAAAAAAAVASLFSVHLLLLTAILYSIRLIPDYLISRYPIKKRKGHLPFLSFLIMELIYPFYFLLVAALSLLPSMRNYSSRD